MAKNTAAAIQFPERLMYSLGGPTPVAFGKAMTFDDRILYGCQPACPGLHWFPHGPVVLGVNTRPNDLESREASRREPQRSAWRRVRALTSGMVSGASWYAAPFVHLHSLIGHGVQGTFARCRSWSTIPGRPFVSRVTHRYACSVTNAKAMNQATTGWPIFHGTP